MKMRALTGDYRVALAAHLKRGGSSSLKKASALGRKAVTLNLETLDLARIHEQALSIPNRNSNRSRDNLNQAAQNFFMEANLQIERTHLAAATATRQWNKISATLEKRTSQLADSMRDVKKRVRERKAAEEALRTRNTRYEKLLKESRSMQESLRTLAHRVLLAQENERGQISRKLHDEIAQVLLGINVRLLTLDQQGSGDAKKLLNEIASTERLVKKCVATMRQAARKIGARYGK
jgi:signal transduction histidine kinase